LCGNKYTNKIKSLENSYLSGKKINGGIIARGIKQKLKPKIK
jgi:hypothetical protein